MDHIRRGRGVLLTALSMLSLAVVSGCEQAGQADTAAKKETPKKSAKIPVVIVAGPVAEPVQESEEFTGRTESMQTVDIRARVSGYLDKIRFKDGEEVAEGDVLFEIDDRPYKAELDRAQATLRQSEARQKRAEAGFRRTTSLFRSNAASRDELDQAEDDFAEARASVGIAAAALERAELDMTFTRVTAPISGRISRRLVDVGNLVKADETLLTTIVDIHRLYVYYDVDERTVLRIRRMIREGTFRSLSEGEVPVEVALVDDQGFGYKGQVNFYESKLEATSGTLRVRADIDNPVTPATGLRSLSPGLFAKVRLPMGQPYDALTIPEEALNSDQGQKFIYIFKEWPPDKQAEFQEKQQQEIQARQSKEKPKPGAPAPRLYRGGDIQILREKDKEGRGQLVLGPLKDRRRVIREGLESSDEVIVTGVQGLRLGLPAKVELPSASAVTGKDKAEEKAAFPGG